MKIIDQLKKVNLIQFVPAIFVISLVGNSVFGYTAPKSEKSKNNSENQVEAATTQAKKKTKKANAGDIDLSKIKDGTYEGQANGYRGLVKVSVTVKDHKITAIKVLSNSDDAAFFNRASAGVIKNILAKQSLKVDVVSGATYSSNGLINAVKNALKEAEIVDKELVKLYRISVDYHFSRKVSYLIQSKNLLLMNTEYDEEVHYDVYLRDTSFLDELNELTASNMHYEVIKEDYIPVEV